MWKYVWIKKCVKIRIILFKNWKLLFENIYQTCIKFKPMWNIFFIILLVFTSQYSRSLGKVCNLRSVWDRTRLWSLACIHAFPPQLGENQLHNCVVKTKSLVIPDESDVLQIIICHGTPFTCVFRNIVGALLSCD